MEDDTNISNPRKPLFLDWNFPRIFTDSMKSLSHYQWYFSENQKKNLNLYGNTYTHTHTNKPDESKQS